MKTSRKMKIPAIMNHIIKCKGYEKAYFGRMLGVSRANIGRRIDSPNPNFNIVLEMLEALEYELVIKPIRGSGADLPSFVVIRADQEDQDD